MLSLLLQARGTGHGSCLPGLAQGVDWRVSEGRETQAPGVRVSVSLGLGLGQ